MKRNYLLFLLVLALGTGWRVTQLLAQDAANERHDNDGAPAHDDDTPALDEDAVAGLLNNLQSPDEAVRREAYDKLRDLGTPVLPYVEPLRESQDEQVRTTADKLVDDIINAGRREQQHDMTQMQKQMEDMIRAMQRQHSRNFDGLTHDLDQWDKDFAAMRRRMLEMRRNWRQGQPQTAQPGMSYSMTTVQNGQRVTLEASPNGAIKVEIQEDGAAAQTYAAASWDEFQRQYPAVVEKYHLNNNGMGGMNIQLFGADTEREQAMRDLMEQDQRASGATFTPATDVVMAQLKLNTPGLIVDSVVGGSFAAELGLQQYDVIVQLNGAALEAPKPVIDVTENGTDGDAYDAIDTTDAIDPAVQAGNKMEQVLCDMRELGYGSLTVLREGQVIVLPYGKPK